MRRSSAGSRAGATRAQRRAARRLHGIDPVHRRVCDVEERLTARVLRMTSADTRQVSPATCFPLQRPAACTSSSPWLQRRWAHRRGRRSAGWE
jgi:hypothetical protein